MGMNEARAVFEAESQSEAKTRIAGLNQKDFEIFCDIVLEFSQPGEITTTSKRGGDGGVDAMDEDRGIAFHYTKRYDTDGKSKEDYDEKWNTNILLTGRPNRSSKNVDEVWDVSKLAKMAMNIKEANI